MLNNTICKYILVAIGILFLGSGTLAAQDHALDSLAGLWSDTSAHDSTRYEAGIGAAQRKMRSGMEPARLFADSLLTFVRGVGNRAWEATVLKFIGNTYAIQGSFPEALEYYVPSHAISLEQQDSSALAITYSNIGTVFYEMGNYTQASENLLQALQISEILGDSANLSRVTNNLGNLYTKLGIADSSNALRYYRQSLDIKKKMASRRTLANAYNNIGLVYNHMGQYNKAIEYLDSSAVMAREMNSNVDLSRALGNMGETYQRSGDYERSLYFLDESIRTISENDDKDGLAHSLLVRGNTYLKLGRYGPARTDCLESLRLSTENQSLNVQMGSCDCLSEAYEGLGNPSVALGYFRQSAQFRDSLLNSEKRREITRQELSYQFEKKHLADSLAVVHEQAARELVYEQDLSRQRAKFNLFVFGGIVLLVLGALIWRNLQKSRKLELQQETVKQQQELVDRLQQVDMLKDQFLANTSHELRTPLNGIIGLSESLRDGAEGKLPVEVVSNLELISGSGRRLANLINDILDFSKLKNDDLELNLRDVDLFPLVNVVLRLMEPLARDKGLILENKVPKDLPLVTADEDRLQQILFNLVGNAIKFTPSGTVTVRAAMEGDSVSVSVTDTGIGIPPERHEQIFESFQQGDGSATRDYGGSGLGLSITRRLVELHGSSLEVASEHGKGAAFTFTLSPGSITGQPETTGEGSPALNRLVVGRADKLSYEGLVNPNGESIAEAIATSGEQDIATGSDAASPRGDKLSADLENTIHSPTRILLADDELVNRRVLRNFLQLGGYDVLEANNGPESIEMLRQNPDIALVLLDVMMPGMSGFQVCEELRREYPPGVLPIVLLTARNQVTDLVEGFNAGANDYLTKPISRNELLSRIRTHLHLNSFHKAASRFVPTEFIRSVGRDTITDVLLGDHAEREVTVLFSDIRDYTRLAERMTPRENFKFVNSYVGRMGPLVHRNRGFVNQFLGDGILALFPKNPADGLRAAIAMQLEIASYNERRKVEGKIPISIGVGLHSGPLIMGIIGDELRNDTAIISDTVNTASRMEGVSKFYGARIILTGDSLKKIPDNSPFGLRFLGKAQVKGKNTALDIYECFDGDPMAQQELKRETLDDFRAALTQFIAHQFPQASAGFDRVLNKNPEDRVARYFLNKCAEYTLGGFPKEKDIAIIFSEK